MNAREKIISDVEAFLSETGMSASTFGMLAAQDPRFLAKLKGVHGWTLTVIERVEAFMKSYADQQRGSE